MKLISACPVKSIVRCKLSPKYQTFYGACLVFFLLLLVLIIPQPAAAHTQYNFPEATEGQFNEAIQKLVPLRFLPSHPLYFLITVKEAISRLLVPSSAERAKFDLVLSGKRLKEAYLLLLRNDVKNSSQQLARYSRRLEEMTKQVEKARSQNQEVTPLTGEIADNLRSHEILFYAIVKKWDLIADSDSFDENLQNANDSFVKTILSINQIIPGVKDRFKIISEEDVGKNQEATESVTVETQLKQASPSAKPRRIIY